MDIFILIFICLLYFGLIEILVDGEELDVFSYVFLFVLVLGLVLEIEMRWLGIYLFKGILDF